MAAKHQTNLPIIHTGYDPFSIGELCWLFSSLGFELRGSSVEKPQGEIRLELDAKILEIDPEPSDNDQIIFMPLPELLDYIDSYTDFYDKEGNKPQTILDYDYSRQGKQDD